MDEKSVIKPFEVTWTVSASDWNANLASSSEQPEPMREAFGNMVDPDPDADQWRPLTGRTFGGERDLSPMAQSKMRKLSRYLWEANPLAKALIELPLAYLLAEGVELKIEDDELQGVLDRFWSDGLNAMGVKLPKRIRELSLFGEQFWPTFVRGDGFVRIGYLDPSQVKEVICDPDNAEQAIGVQVGSEVEQNVRTYRVIVNVEEAAFSQKAQALRKTFTAGDIFLMQINDLCTGTRGRGDLLASMDWLDAYDQFLFGDLERADMLRSFIWDVEINGDESAVKKRAKEIKRSPPNPASVNVHNNSEKWTALAPKIGSGESDTQARLIRTHIGGGQSIPEHWLGAGGDVNRSTANAMHEPTEKRLTLRQTYYGHCLCELGKYVIIQRWIASGQHEDGERLTDEQLDTLGQISVVWPELSRKDTTSYAAAMQQVTVAAALAIKSKMMTRATGLAHIQAMSDRMGVEFDAEIELAAVEDEMAKIEEEDNFVPNPAAMQAAQEPDEDQ